MIAAFLPAPAYAVVRAYGGTEAIVLAQRLHPDLILLDLMMPDVSGFDVVDALQRNADTARIPIIVVTAKHDHRAPTVLRSTANRAAWSASSTRRGSTATGSWPRCDVRCRSGRERR